MPCPHSRAPRCGPARGRASGAQEWSLAPKLSVQRVTDKRRLHQFFDLRQGLVKGIAIWTVKRNARYVDGILSCLGESQANPEPLVVHCRIAARAAVTTKYA